MGFCLPEGSLEFRGQILANHDKFHVQLPGQALGVLDYFGRDVSIIKKNSDNLSLLELSGIGQNHSAVFPAGKCDNAFSVGPGTISVPISMGFKSILGGLADQVMVMAKTASSIVQNLDSFQTGMQQTRPAFHTVERGDGFSSAQAKIQA